MGVQDANHAGFVHGGIVMKTCDEAAAIAAIRHCGRRVVTAGVDRMTFTEPVSSASCSPARRRVNAAWRTSMEVGVRVEAENPRSGERRHTSTAYVTMVALDDDGKPTAVPGAASPRPRPRSAASARPSCGAPTGSPSATRSSASAALIAQRRRWAGAAATLASTLTASRCRTGELRKLAIVPAYNEAGMVGRVVRDIAPPAPGLRRARGRRRLHRRDRREAEAEGAVVIRHPYNLGIGGAMQSGYKYALRNGYDVAVQVDGDGQHKSEYLPELLAALQTGGDEADMVYGSRFRGDPGYKVPFGRRVGNLIFSVVLTRDHPPEDHRPDLGLSDDQPPRDRALRPRLSARLSRGRGAADAARPPPAHPRGPGADERPRLRPQLDRLPAQRLLHGQGAAGAVRRPLSPPPDPGRGDRGGRARVGPPADEARRPAPAGSPGASVRRDERHAVAAGIGVMVAALALATPTRQRRSR